VSLIKGAFYPRRNWSNVPFVLLTSGIQVTVSPILPRTANVIDWACDEGGLIAMASPDRPAGFKFRWKDAAFQVALSPDSGGTKITITGVLARIPYSGESVTARAQWRGLFQAERKKPFMASILSLDPNGAIKAQFVTQIDEKLTAARLSLCISICLLQLAPSMSVFDAFKKSDRLHRLLNARARLRLGPDRSGLDP
jgi:hypothetical protein